MTFKTWKVSLDDMGWVVHCENEIRFESRHQSKDVAIRYAKRLAMENSPGQVVIHDVNGDVVSAIHYNGLDREADASDASSTEGPTVEAEA